MLALWPMLQIRLMSIQRLIQTDAKHISPVTIQSVQTVTIDTSEV